MGEKNLKEKTIVVGVREDNSLYFDMTPNVTPHEALGMVAWLSTAIQSSVERQQMIGVGAVLETIKGIASELQNIHKNVLTSNEKVLKALKLTIGGVSSVFSLFKPQAEEEEKKAE